MSVCVCVCFRGKYLRNTPIGEIGGGGGSNQLGDMVLVYNLVLSLKISHLI